MRIKHKMKPTLEQFNLTENDLIKYKKMVENYNAQLAEQRKQDAIYNANLKKIAIVVPVVLAIVWFISIILELLVFKQEIPIVSIVLLYVMQLPGVAISLINFHNTLGEILSSFLVLILPFIGLGISICVSYEHDEKSIKQRLYKERYIDADLEKRVIRYREELSQYEHDLEKMRVDYWNNLTGLQFEKEVAKLFEQQGYCAFVTKAVGDGGVDIVLNKEDERVAVQCKHHKSKVGPNDVRALQGVVYNGDYTSGIFVSLNGFTPTVYQEVADGRVRIELLTLTDLLNLQRSIVNNK